MSHSQPIEKNEVPQNLCLLKSSINPKIPGPLIVQNLIKILLWWEKLDVLNLQKIEDTADLQKYNFSQIVIALVELGVIQVELKEDSIKSVDISDQKDLHNYPKTGVVRYVLQRRRPDWRKIPIKVNFDAMIRGQFCYVCVSGGVLFKCANCWRSFHFNCGRRFHTKRTCGVCEIEKLVEIDEEFEAEFATVTAVIEKMPTGLRSIVGAENLTFKSRKMDLRALLDILFFHKMVCGHTRDVLRLRRSLLAQPNENYRPSSMVKPGRSCQVWSVNAAHPIKRIEKLSDGSQTIFIANENDIVCLPGKTPGEGDSPSEEAQKFVKRVVGEARALQVNLQGHKQRSKGERIPWSNEATEVLLEHFATVDDEKPQLPGIDHPRCVFCRAKAKFKANCQCRLHSYCFECHKQGRSNVQCETPRNQKDIIDKKKALLSRFAKIEKKAAQIGRKQLPDWLSGKKVINSGPQKTFIFQENRLPMIPDMRRKVDDKKPSMDSEDDDDDDELGDED